MSSSFSLAPSLSWDSEESTTVVLVLLCAPGVLLFQLFGGYPTLSVQMVKEDMETLTSSPNVHLYINGIW